LGINGDFYLNDTNQDVYTKSGGAWGSAICNIKGATGATGSYAAPRVNTVTTSANPAINTDTTDEFIISALSDVIASMTTNLTGTPANRQKLIISILDAGTAKGITWGAKFVSRGATLPTTTVVNKWVNIGLKYNSAAAVWDCIAVAQE
jgi:hypothetical protein